MKYFFLNDQTKDLNIHGASVDNITASGKKVGVAQATQLLEVEIPENSVPFVKVWNNSVFLSYVQQSEDNQ